MFNIISFEANIKNVEKVVFYNTSKFCFVFGLSHLLVTYEVLWPYFTKKMH